MADELVENVRREAEASYAAGLCCAEAVVLALAKAQGVDSEVLPRMASAFCTGMARTGGECGAITGALMGLGLAFGRSGPGADNDAAFAAAQRLVREFEAEFGARDCPTLLGGCDLATFKGRAVYQLKRMDTKCARYTARAAEIAATIIRETKPA